MPDAVLEHNTVIPAFKPPFDIISRMAGDLDIVLAMILKSMLHLLDFALDIGGALKPYRWR